jgi:micrococcal nuclease
MARARILAALVAAALAVAGGCVWLSGRAAGAPAGGRVVRVIDGDTIVVDGGHGAQTIRLLGIDTPETVDPNEPVGCYGPEASAFSKHLMTGRDVTLRYDRERVDRYGRWLAYVYLAGAHRRFVNALLVRRGFARTLSIPPNTGHERDLAALERQAALAGRGLWGAC